MHATINLTLDQIHLVVAALGQLCGKAIAANEAELYGLAYSTQQIFEAHEKALKRREP